MLRLTPPWDRPFTRYESRSSKHGQSALESRAREPYRGPSQSEIRMVAFRFLARRKAVGAIAIGTMALALGANTAAMSVLNAFLFSSLAMPDAERVFTIMPQRNMPGRGTVVFNDAYANYQLLRQTQHSFSDVATYVNAPGSWDDRSELRPISVTRATA